MSWVPHAEMMGRRAQIAGTPDEVDLLHAKGAVANREGRLDDAQRHLSAALAVAEGLPAGHEDAVIAVLNPLAFTYTQRGEHVQAKSLLLRALRIGEEVLGEDHLTVANLHNTLGNANVGAGDYAAAREHYRQTIEVRRRSFGNESGHVATALSNLASSMLLDGDGDGASEVLQEALAILKGLPGDHPDEAYVENGLANVELLRRDYPAAARHARRAVVLWEGALEAHDLAAVGGLLTLGEALSRGGDADEALAPLHRALAIRAEVLGAEHQLTAAVRTQIESAQRRAHGGMP